MNKKKFKKNSFNLANCPKPLKGTRAKYIYKVNVHHCVFSNSNFENVRYRSGHITQSTFKRAKLNNVDFICVNLRDCKFRNTFIKDCIFFGCNLDGTDFENAKFENVFFIRCKIKNIKRKFDAGQVRILTQYPSVKISSELKKTIMLMAENQKLEKFRILTINNNKINLWMLNILLEHFTQEEINKFFLKLLKDNKTKFFTLNDYLSSLCNYYKKC